MNNPLDQSVNKLADSANLSSESVVIPETAPPFAQVETVSEESVFTGESEQVAMGNFRKILQTSDSLPGLKSASKIEKNIVTPEAPINAAPVKVEKQKKVTKAQQREISKIQEQAVQEPIISTEDLTKVAENKAQAADLQTEVAKLDAAEGVAPVTPINNLSKSISELPEITEEGINDVLLKSIELNKIPQSQDELVALAQKAGFDAPFLRDLRNTPNISETVVKSIAIADNALSELKEAGLKAAQMSAQGISKTSDEYVDVVRKMQTYSYLVKQAYGIRQDVGRALNAYKIQPSSINIKEDLAALMSDENIDDTLRMIISNSIDDATRGKIITSALVPNGWAKAKVLYGAGVLGKLGTQAKLIVGEVGNSLIEPVIRTGAAASWYATYPIKSMLGMNTEERYYFKEALAMVQSYPAAFSNGWNLAKEAWATGKVAGGRVGDDIGRTSLDVFNYDDNGSLLSKGVKTLNLLSTYGPRMIIAEGDFFKGVHHRMGVEAEAVRKEIDAYGAAIDAGVSHDEAKVLASAARQEVFDNPPEYLFDEAKKIVLEAPPGPVVKAIENVSRRDDALGLATKITFAFMRTSVNDIKRLIEHTPAQLGVDSIKGAGRGIGYITDFLKSSHTKSISEDLASYDAKRVDMALSKIGVGTMAMAAGTYAAMNDKITGKGPTDRGARQAMERQGWQKYSLVLNVGKLSEADKNQWESLSGTTVGKGEYAGKVFISYNGTSLMGAWLSTSANVADYVKYEKDNDKINAVVAASSMGLYDYAMDGVFLPGVADIVKTFQLNNYGEESVKFDTVVQTLVQSGLMAAKEMIPGIGVAKTVRGFTDGQQRNVSPDDPYDGPAMRGFQAALNSLMNDTPGLSDNLPAARNLWGEPVSHQFPLSPIRATAGKAQLADQLIIESRAGLEMPKQTVSKTYKFDTLSTTLDGKPMTIDVDVNVKLNPEEYNELLQIANVDLKLEKRIEDVAKRIPEYERIFRANEPGIVQEQVNRRKTKVIEQVRADIISVNEEVFEAARKQLLEKSVYSQVINERAEAEAERKMSQYKYPGIGK